MSPNNDGKIGVAQAKIIFDQAAAPLNMEKTYQTMQLMEQ